MADTGRLAPAIISTKAIGHRRESQIPLRVGAEIMSCKLCTGPWHLFNAIRQPGLCTSAYPFAVKGLARLVLLDTGMNSSGGTLEVPPAQSMLSTIAHTTGNQRDREVVSREKVAGLLNGRCGKSSNMESAVG